MTELNFESLEPIEVPVWIAGKEYLLKEADGHAASVYQDAQSKCVRLGPDGKPNRIEGMGGLESLLVSLCLFDRSGKRFSQQEVQRWPNRIVKTLYNKIREISRLQDEEALPNSVEVTGDVTQAGLD